ncbi:MAG: hypothetical protein WCD70_10055 [Alphaproteobacteria bacterium]
MKIYKTPMSPKGAERLGNLVCMTEVMSEDAAAALAIDRAHEVICVQHQGGGIVLIGPDGRKTRVRQDHINRSQVNEERALVKRELELTPKNLQPKDIILKPLAIGEDHIQKLKEIVSMTTAPNELFAFLMAVTITHFLVEAKYHNGMDILARKKDGSETEIPFPEVPTLPKSAYRKINIPELEA